MKIRDVIFEDNNDDIAHDEKLAAIGQLFVDRSDEENTESRMSTQAFIHLANRMGLSLTSETLMDLAQSGDLTNIIKDVNQDEVIFHGKGDVDLNAAMTVDKARDTVKKMAKRQLD